MIRLTIADGLTPAQDRMLAEIEAAGVRVYNGRARRTIEALERLGQIEADYDSVAQAKGGGIELVQRITVRLRNKPELTVQTKFEGTCGACGMGCSYRPLHGSGRSCPPRLPFVNVTGSCGQKVRLEAVQASEGS